MSNSSKRIYYFDVLRAVACVMVIVIHTVGTGMIFPADTAEYWVGNFFASLGRMAVPVFMMISGALYLDENKSFGISDGVRAAKKWGLVFAFWSVLYFLYWLAVTVLVGKRPLTVAGVFTNLETTSYHLWYLLMLIGMFFIIPLMKLWVKKENKKWVEYALLVGTFFSFVIPQIVEIGCLFAPAIFGYADYLMREICIKYISTFVCYFLLGWYLHHFSLSKKLVYVLGIYGFCMTFLGSGLLSLVLNTTVTLHSVMDANSYFYGAMSFILAKEYFNQEGRFSGVVGFWAKHSLTVYLVHVFWVQFLSAVLPRLGIDSFWIQTPILLVGAFVGSLISSFVMKKIPFLKRFV